MKRKSNPIEKTDYKPMIYIEEAHNGYAHVYSSNDDCHILFTNRFVD